MTPLRHATALETVRVSVPEHAVEAFEAALATGCGTVGFFLDEDPASGRSRACATWATTRRRSTARWRWRRW